MANEGLLFEWSIVAVAASKSPNIAFKNSPLAKESGVKYKLAPSVLKSDAANAVKVIESKHGDILNIEKLSGGGVEPKTDLYVTTKRGVPLKCSLKYGKSIQLSSGGVATSVKFLTGVLSNLRLQKGFDAKQVAHLLGVLAELEEHYGDLGKLPQDKAKSLLKKGSSYDIELQRVLGGRMMPAEEAFAAVKFAIIEEAITGKFTFSNNKKLIADHILSEKQLLPIDKKLIQKVADNTTVRLALKGRGKETFRNKIIRMNEIVLRFDTKT